MVRKETPTVSLRLYGPLDRIRFRKTAGPEYALPLPSRRSVKDLLEAEGVPHTEVSLVLVSGQPGTMDTVLSGGERVSAYPPFSYLQTSARPRTTPGLIADVHLGKLARRLRLLGMDCIYDSLYDDEEIARRSAMEGRVLLTRDRGLLMRRRVTSGILILSSRTDEQTYQVLERLSPLREMRPFSRCLDCNGLLRDVPREDVPDLLPPRTRSAITACLRCADCGKAYWKGSHWKALEAWVQVMLRRMDALQAWHEKSPPSDSGAGTVTDI